MIVPPTLGGLYDEAARALRAAAAMPAPAGRVENAGWLAGRVHRQDQTLAG